MKKGKIIFLLIGVSLLITGCDGDITREIRHDDFTLQENSFTCDELIGTKKERNTTPLFYMNENFAITKKGEVYNISLTQPYTNKKNCKLSEFQQEITATFDQNVVKAVDGKIYYTPTNSGSNQFREILVTDNNYSLYTLFLNDPSILRVVTVDSNQGIYYVLKTDGNVYQEKVAKNSYQGNYTIVDNIIIYDSNQYGKIIDFNYSESNRNTIFLKTENTYYRMYITNREECNKYADITCVYKLKKDKVLTKYYDSILYFNGSLLVMNYGRVFQVQ